MSGRIPRRSFLAGSVAAGAGATLGAVTATAATAPQTPAAGLKTRVPFAGLHQAGVATPRPAHAIFVAFDAVAQDRPGLAATLQDLSAHAARLTRGYDALLGNPGGGPTVDSGVVGNRVEPDALTVTIGFGNSLFDGRYGLQSRKPDGLSAMPTFPDDSLDPAECHGDVLVQLCANTQETLLNALRDLMRATRAGLGLRWKIEGYLPAHRESGAGRNLLGFKDGTSNPDTTDDEQLGRLVWQPGGGTFQVVRLIRNCVEFWDRVALDEQELMIGRRKDTGAPLDGRRESDIPGFAADPKGAAIPLDAHIRLANPRTAATEPKRILRRGYNYSRGVDPAGQLDMGLIFSSFQRHLSQFVEIQRRLAGEPLVDYVVPTGGGFFYVPRGARDVQDWVGSDLFV